MIDAIHAAVNGLQISSRKFATAANDVVEQSAGISSDSVRGVQAHLPSAFVDMKLAEQSYKASLVVLITAQEMSSALLTRDEDA